MIRTRDHLAEPVVIIATRGRRAEVTRLIASLADQTLTPRLVIVVGAGSEDLPKPLIPSGLEVAMLTTNAAGLTRQRNAGLARAWEVERSSSPIPFIVFFDDDFRPANDWLEKAAAAFRCSPALTGLTGHVLADGIGGDPVTEAEAQNYLQGRTTDKAHWSRVSAPKSVESLYGCNMAVQSASARVCWFDEDLPLYGWQEDCDYTGQLRKRGRAEIRPECRGVHLGSQVARTSGVRLGYSQIANPVRILHRGNMTRLRAARFLAQALLANTVKASLAAQRVDYPGRLRGNVTAIRDLFLGRCRPDRVLEL